MIYLHSVKDKNRIFTGYQIFVTGEILVFHRFLYNNECLLYRQECFTEKYTTRKIHTKLHPGLEWCIFQILTSEDIDDVISRLFSVVSANSR